MHSMAQEAGRAIARKGGEPSQVRLMLDLDALHCQRQTRLSMAEMCKRRDVLTRAAYFMRCIQQPHACVRRGLLRIEGRLQIHVAADGRECTDGTCTMIEDAFATAPEAAHHHEASSEQAAP